MWALLSFSPLSGEICHRPSPILRIFTFSIKTSFRLTLPPEGRMWPSRTCAIRTTSLLLERKAALAHRNNHPFQRQAVSLRMRQELGWQSCLKLDLLSGDRMVKLQNMSVQKISPIARKAG